MSADRPGFIVNRILMPFLAEAMRAYEEGLGTADDIDTGARIGLNHPMGPLELADFIGLDVCLGIMRVLDEGLDDEQFAPPRVLVELVDAGHLGQKTGRGFYTYPRPERARAARPVSGEPRPPRSGCSRRPCASSRPASWPRRAIERDEAERFDRALFARMGELGLTARAAPRGGRRGGLLVPRLDAGHGGARRRRHGDGRLAVGPRPLAVPGRHLGDRRAAGPLAAGDARRRGARGVRADRTEGRQRRRGDPDAGRARRAGRRARRLPADGHEDLDLERPGGRALPRLRHARSGARARRRSPPSSSRRARPGFRFGAHETKMGIRACPAAELVFDGAEVPVANRLGAEGDGYRIALSALGEGRISIAAACVGHRARRAGSRRRATSRERRAFGAPLAEQQGVRFMLAEMAREVAAARAVTREAAPGQGPRRAARRGVVARQVDRVGRGDAGDDRRGPALRRAPATRARPASSA